MNAWKAIAAGMVAAVASIGAGAAEATVYVVNFSGTTTSSTIAGTDGSFSGSFTYDSSVAAYVGGPDASTAQYHASTGLTFTSGTQSFAVTASPTTSYVQIGNDPTLDSLYVNFTGGSYSGGFKNALLFFWDTTGTAFNSSALPEGVSLAAFDYAKNFTVKQDDGSGSDKSFNGQLTSMSFTAVPTNNVPEPAAWAMMIAGFGMIGAAMRRGRNAAFLAA